MEKFREYSALLRECLLFRNMSTLEIEQLIDEASPKIITVKKKESLHMPENMQDIYVVLSGRFNVVHDSGMNNSLVHTLTPYRCFGIAFCAEQIPCHHILQAAETGELLRLSYAQLLACSDTREKLLINLLGITSENLLVLSEKISHTQAHSVRVKLSVYLRDQMARHGKPDFMMDMNRKDLANYLNITYPAMIREFSRMTKEGILSMEGDHIRINDVEALIEEGSEYNIL